MLHIIEGVDATWYAGTAPKTESTVTCCMSCVKLQGSAKRLQTGFVNAAGKFRQR